MIKIGNNKIGDIKLGDRSINKIYKGDSLVFNKVNIRRVFTINRLDSEANQINELQELFNSIWNLGTTDNVLNHYTTLKINNIQTEIKGAYYYSSMAYVSSLQIDTDILVNTPDAYYPGQCYNLGISVWGYASEDELLNNMLEVYNHLGGDIYIPEYFGDIINVEIL